MSNYEILYEDEYLIAVNKPAGIFVHRSKLDPKATVFMVQEIRNVVGHKVYPVHRLDRKTSGALIFAKNKEVQRSMNNLFKHTDISKKYLAIVRGYAPDFAIIDYPLKYDNGKVKEAKTTIMTIQKVEIPISSGKFLTSRYSLLYAYPYTGRMHQIRRHLAHIFHPIIGDRPHGCNKQNRFFLHHFNLTEMMLHAYNINFKHPVTHNYVYIRAPFRGEFLRILTELGFQLPEFDLNILLRQYGYVE
jgi:tRNA pseudouridine65 synthase